MEEKDVQVGMRLNKYIAHCGICNRRQAVDLIKGGLVKVNEEVEKNPAVLINAEDVVAYKNRVVKPLEPTFYVLMNKPKNVSVHQEENVRKSVFDIVQPKYDQPLAAVSALDKTDLGLMLLTNDKEIVEKFNLPDAEYIRVYHLTLSKPMSVAHLVQIKDTEKISGQKIHIQNVDFLKEEDHHEVGIELIQGSLDQIRTLFQDLDYQIEKLDCLNFANLTKKDLPRGWFRDLTPKEIVLLKHFV